MNTKKIKENILDTIFPEYCVECRKIDTLLCDRCRKKIVLIKAPLCLGCGKLSPRGKYCINCRKKTNLTGVIVVAHYEEGPLKEAIHTYKYDFVYALADDLYEYLADALKVYGMIDGYVLTYVPLHKKRKNWRGFNQSRLLTEKMAEKIGIELYENLLKRVKDTGVQIGLKRLERLENMKGTFRVVAKNTYKVRGKKIIIVDDVITTGATLNECAKELCKLGAKEVWGLVLGKH